MNVYRESPCIRIDYESDVHDDFNETLLVDCFLAIVMWNPGDFESDSNNWSNEGRNSCPVL